MEAHARRRRPRPESTASGSGDTGQFFVEKSSKMANKSSSTDPWTLPAFYSHAKSHLQHQSAASVFFRPGTKGDAARRAMIVAALLLLLVLWGFAKLSVEPSNPMHVPILLPYLSSGIPMQESIGGWIVRRKYSSRFLLQKPLKDLFNKTSNENDPWRDEEDEDSKEKTSEASGSEPAEDTDSETSKVYDPPQARDENGLLPDYGGLVFVSLDNSKLPFRRSIRKNDAKLYNIEREQEMEAMNNFYISKRHWHDDELEDIDMECRRPNWEFRNYANCNAFHEVDLSRNYDEELARRIGDLQEGGSRYLSHGWFRDVLLLDRPIYNASAVLKVARYNKHDINYRSMFSAQRDALVMERLSASPRIVDIYGLCGSSVMVESLPREMEKYIVPKSGYAKKEDLNDEKDVDIKNEFTVEEKLYIALEMAESIADLHGFKDGAIVHDDIQLCQWLRNKEGMLKLGDFNRARVLQWNDEDREYCKYNNGKGYGNYRSPEEYAEKDLDEKIDVYSFGNNIYGLLTGLWVFYENEDDGVVQSKVVNGTRAFIDVRYRIRSYIEGRLVDLMERCWTYNPLERISIFQAVDFLKETVKEHERREAEKAKGRET